VMVIGIDPHKRQHTAAVLDRLTQRHCDSIAIEASLAGYRRLLAWAMRWPERTWAVENARGLGRHLAQWLLARGETMVMCRPPRPDGCGSSPVASDARTM
jgi:transposase